MRLIQSESYSNRAEWIESHLAGRINPLVKYSYANRNNEDLGGSAKRSGDPDMATSSSKPASTAARGAAGSGIQTAEQMDSRRSVRPFGRTACWRRPVGRDAAGKAACRSRRACSHPFDGGVAHELGLFCARLILSGFGWPVARRARHQVSTMADRSRENCHTTPDRLHRLVARSPEACSAAAQA